MVVKPLKTLFHLVTKDYFKYLNISFSQEGEDLFLKRYFGDQPNGFYIDIGAHHPKRFSNTFVFYQKGWSGINVDPLPNVMRLFRKERPRDINLELGISQMAGKLKYYMFNEPALNTFSADEANKKNGFRNYKIIDTKFIDTLPLSKVLTDYLPANQIIDFLTVDVEGLDLEVIRSNDWEKFRPRLVLVEDLKRGSLDEIQDNQVYLKMSEIGYALIGKTFNTLIFEDRKR